MEVKTASWKNCRGRWEVTLATRGGNQSWSGKVKKFDPGRCDYLFVHVGDGRRWLIPTAALDGTSAICLGGPKYSEFEVETGSPLGPHATGGPLHSPPHSGEYRSGQPGQTVNLLAQSFVGSNPASPTPVATTDPIKPSNRERKLGRTGRAIVNQKRRITIPQSAFFEAGLQNGSKVCVRADGPGRIVVEQVELPDWAALVDESTPEASSA